MNGHEDIDLLCSDLDDFVRFTSAQNLHCLRTRNNYVIRIADSNVRFDIRYVGDGYYDAKWEKDMLAKRVMHKAMFYVMDSGNFRYSLAYHALVHKKFLSEEYKKLLCIGDEGYLINLVKSYCHEHEYLAAIPSDPGVTFNRRNANIIGKEKNLKLDLERLILKLKSRAGLRV